MKNAELSPRLSSAAEFVRWGAVFADVGTDHAYLPLFLLSKGKIERAVCSDINAGPLENAEKNALGCGFSEKIEFVLSDGADLLAGKGITDLAICGMGGELIADIIDKAEFLKTDKVRLILQPMSKQAHLRKYLAKCGFRILGESYSSEGRHNYVCMLAEYTGKPYEISDAEAELGYPPYDFENDAARKAYSEERLNALQKSVRGKRLGGEASEAEEKALEDVKKILKG